MIGETGFHGGSDAERTVDSHKIIIGKIQGERRISASETYSLAVLFLSFLPPPFFLTPLACEPKRALPKLFAAFISHKDAASRGILSANT